MQKLERKAKKLLEEEKVKKRLRELGYLDEE